MLQLLLENRFKLTSHHGTRQLPIYQLTVERGRPRLQISKEGSCTPYPVNLPPRSAASYSHSTFCGLHLTVDGFDRTLDGKGVTMAVLAANLSRTYSSTPGRNVVDVTGLKKIYDIHLKWAVEPRMESGSNDNALPPELDSPSIFIALQEQLGLKLKPAKGPVDVLVIDHIEKPSPD